MSGLNPGAALARLRDEVAVLQRAVETLGLRKCLCGEYRRRVPETFRLFAGDADAHLVVCPHCLGAALRAIRHDQMRWELLARWYLRNRSRAGMPPLSELPARLAAAVRLVAR
ncbi:MAG TPA: hypothetical protein VIY27_11190 [Myxococcota bacterium]